MVRAAFYAGIAVALMGLARADQVDRTLAEIGACAAIADNAQRLACYDAAAPKVRATLNTATQDDKVTLFGLDLFGSGNTTSNEPRTPEAFGKSDLPAVEVKQEGGVVTEITAGLADYSRNGGGYDVFVLDNGQVWRQTEPANMALPSDIAGMKVTIKEGSLGSYILERTGSNRSVKVKRVR